MERIKTPTRVPDKFGPGKAGFTDGNPQTGLSSTQLEAAWFDSSQEEIANAIELSFIALNAADMTQLYQAIRAQVLIVGDGRWLPLTGGQIYLSGQSDRLILVADAGQNARIRYHVSGVREWIAGVNSDGTFVVYDQTGGTYPLYIPTYGVTNLRGASIYWPGTHDPLLIYADAGHYARIRYVTAGYVGWLAGSDYLGRYMIGDGATYWMWIDNATGRMHTGTHFNIGGAGAQYEGLGGVDIIGYTWSGSAINAYVNGNFIGSLATGSTSGYLPLTGGVLAGPGNLTVNGTVVASAGSYLYGAYPGYPFSLMVAGQAQVQSTLEVHGLGDFKGAITAGGTITGNVVSAYNGVTGSYVSAVGNVTAGNILASNNGANIGNWGTGGANLAVGWDCFIRASLVVGTGSISQYMGRWDGGVIGGQGFLENNGVLMQNHNAAFGKISPGPQVQVQIFRDLINQDWDYGSGLGTAYRARGLADWDIVCDPRLKTDVELYHTGLEAVRRLEPVTYRRLDGVDGQPLSEDRLIGLMADAAAGVIPEMVFEHDIKVHPNDTEDTRVQMMNTHALNFAFINSFKELADRIEAIEARLAELSSATH